MNEPNRFAPPFAELLRVSSQSSQNIAEAAQRSDDIWVTIQRLAEEIAARTSGRA